MKGLHFARWLFFFCLEKNSSMSHFFSIAFFQNPNKKELFINYFISTCTLTEMKECCALRHVFIKEIYYVFFIQLIDLFDIDVLNLNWSSVYIRAVFKQECHFVLVSYLNNARSNSSSCFNWKDSLKKYLLFILIIFI